MTPADDQASGSSRTFTLFAVLHVVCCGLPLLLLSGVSLAFLAPLWPIAAGVLAVLGAIGFAWYRLHRRPRNGGPVRPHASNDTSQPFGRSTTCPRPTT